MEQINKNSPLTTERAVHVLRTGIELSDEVGHHRLFLDRVWDSCGAAGLNAFEEPCHVAAKFAHHLHAFFVLTDLVGGAAVDHIPVF